MVSPCATVRRVIPGQISIVGFSAFHFRMLRESVRRANFWGAHAARVLVSASRRNELCYLLFPDSFGTCHSTSFAGKMLVMKILTSLITILFATFIATSSFAQTPATSPAGATPLTATQPASATGQPDPQEMMKQMVEMSKLNENHKLLADMNGNWNYAIKMWMSPDPNAKPQESKGTATRKAQWAAATPRWM